MLLQCMLKLSKKDKFKIAAQRSSVWDVLGFLLNLRWFLKLITELKCITIKYTEIFISVPRLLSHFYVTTVRKLIIPQ